MPFFRWGLILLLLPPFLANAQEDAEETSQPWWEYGLHVGAFSADNFSAGFYNGTGDNDINRILENQYYYEEIYQELGQHFSPGELPQQMRYQIAAVPGLHLEYHFSESFSIFARLHYIKLKTSDVFTLKYDSVSYGTFDTYFIGNIYGTEERAYIDLGIRKHMLLRDGFSWYLTAALNINNTTVIENKINIGSLQYSIKTNYSTTPYVPNTPVNDYQFRQGGIGVGLAGGGGIKYQFNNLYVAMDVNVYYTQTILPGREHFGIQIAPLFRMGYRSTSLL